MEEDIKRFNKVLDDNFPNLNVGKKQDLVIRQWIEYATIHMNSHPCDEFRKILVIRGNQIRDLANK